MSGVRMLQFLKDWWKFIQIHQYYTMALTNVLVAALPQTMGEIKAWKLNTIHFIKLSTLSVKRNITSSERHSLKSSSSKWNHIWTQTSCITPWNAHQKNKGFLESKRGKMQWNCKRKFFKNHRKLPFAISPYFSPFWQKQTCLFFFFGGGGGGDELTKEYCCLPVSQIWLILMRLHFSECRSKEVINFFWRSVYRRIHLWKVPTEAPTCHPAAKCLNICQESISLLYMNCCILMCVLIWGMIGQRSADSSL